MGLHSGSGNSQSTHPTIAARLGVLGRTIAIGSVVAFVLGTVGGPDAVGETMVGGVSSSSSTMCTPSELATSPGSGGVGMGGFAVLSILLHNDSSVMCTLTGNATATVVGSTGAAILTSTPIAGATNLGNYAVTTVAVPSGGEAQLFVGFGGGACPAGSALEIAIPGAAAPLTFSATPATGMCGSQLETSPFVPPAVQLFSSYPPIPSSSPDISTASACSGSNLAGTQGQVIPDGSNTDVELILTNVSTAPCSLGSRWPAVNVSGGTTSVIGSFTAWMPSYIATLGGSEQPNSSLTLAPDSGAVAFIELPTTGSGIDCVAPTLAHITLPRSSVSLSVSLSDPSLQICADESTPTNPSQTTTGSSIVTVHDLLARCARSSTTERARPVRNVAWALPTRSSSLRHRTPS
jgi:hypothetical protein